MAFEYLTPNAEALLSEILIHRDDKGNCFSEYWEKRFETLSFSDECILRSTFKELSDSDMISVQWAGNCPYHMVVLNAGISYEVQKKRHEQELKSTNRRAWVQCLISGLAGVILTLLVQSVIPLVQVLLGKGG
ncbi:hypothetical protein K440107A6_26390 [Lawsonibacter asaccharolyticus]